MSPWILIPICPKLRKLQLSMIMLFEACMKRDKSYSEGYGSGEDVSGKGHRK